MASCARAFTQDDAHVFITEEQIAAEALAMNDLILDLRGFRLLRRGDQVLRPAREAHRRRRGVDKAEAALMATLKASGRPWTLNKGEGAFYGPKLEYVLRDAIGRDWQCGTIQVDLNMPGRLGAFYIDEHSNKVTPVMLHRAMFGCWSASPAFSSSITPATSRCGWRRPRAVIATIVSDADGYAREAADLARRSGLGSNSTCATRRSTTRCASTAGQGAGAPRGRQEGSGDPHGLDPPARRAGPAGGGAG
jgi:threonyl-tRNA synthetase